ncbi:DUF2339 domain-containing protein [Rufibacter sp. DG15C]|uniref:DUF2339 domain-containing protein n=1 Tax=Rufibacter sp. DG15C TaxID=1379909 RepID=UPI0008358E8E|nr:DUF2339 domain-containing protein [Rufibacter sp. DG15C]
MEIALLLTLLVLLIVTGSRLLKRLEQQSHTLERLHDEVRHLREQQAQRPSAPPRDAAALAAQRDTASTSTPVQEPIPAPVPLPPPPSRPAPKPPVLEPYIPERTATAAFTPVEDEKPSRRNIFSSFTENLDWEKFIGENLINKLGIAILVLGIGFFVKYAIDQDWINEIGRVAIGLLAGGALIAVAHRLRVEYKAFSSVLVGGGMAILYFTIAIAFHEYQLFSQTAAFLLMVAITGFTILLSIAYDRIELAVLALIGGFGSPFMLSTGEGNYVVLFSFILVLNVGILVLAYFKKWNLLNLIAYVFTIILYGGWLGTQVVSVPNAPLAGALLFATLFYLVFFLMNMVYNLKESRRFTAPEILVLLSNSFLYYAAGMYILTYLGRGQYQGLFTILLAVFNFVFAFALYRRQQVDRNLVYLLIGLVLTFVSLTAPVQLEGNYITLFWALEAVLLLWLFQRSGIQLLKSASVLVLGLMVVSLAMDWMGYTITRTQLSPLINKLFITGEVAVVGLAGTWWLLGKEEVNAQQSRFWHRYRQLVGTALVICLYLVLVLELDHQLSYSSLTGNAQTLVFGLFHYLYLLGLVWWGQRRGNPVYQWGALAFSLAAILSYLVILHPTTIETRNAYLLGQGETMASFLLHYLPFLLILVLLVAMVRLLQRMVGLHRRLGKIGLWLVSFVAVFLASAELEHWWMILFFEAKTGLYALQQHIQKIGFPILWGVASFILMAVGMSKKLKTLRIISLSLFFLTLVKLFLFDIRGISEGGKIAAFICLGVILLVVSFMYQKLKNLILVDDAQTPDSSSHSPEA